MYKVVVICYNLQVFLYEDVLCRPAAAPQESPKQRSKTAAPENTTHAIAVAPTQDTSRQPHYFVLITNQMLLLVGVLVRWMGLEARIKSLKIDGE